MKENINYEDQSTFMNVAITAKPDDIFVLQWTHPKFGFGEATFYHDGTMELCCSDEMMGRKFVKDMLIHMVDNCKFESE